MDANARIGSVPVTDLYGTVQIGTHGAQKENSNGRRFRDFVQRAQLQVQNTLTK